MCLSLGIALFLSANLLYAGGRRTFRHFVFPLVFFFLAVPIPKIVWNPIVFSLQSMITWLNVETLNLMGIPAMKVGHVIQLPRCTVGVDEACSGIRSLQSSLMAALFVGDLMLRRPGSRVVFLVAGLVLAVIGNFLRSLYLSLTANRLGPEGLKAVHDTAGWSVLIFTAAGVVALAWWFTRKEDRLQGRRKRLWDERSGSRKEPGEEREIQSPVVITEVFPRLVGRPSVAITSRNSGSTTHESFKLQRETFLVSSR